MQGFKPIRHCDERSEEAIQEKNIQNKFANCNAGKILNQVQDDKYFGLRCKDDRKKSKRKGNVISWIASLSLTMTPFGTFRDGNVLKKKAAFTLAEVLITLGIIGVVAALTLPGLLAEYSKLVVETKLKKFYSQINQAIQLSEAEYGAKEYWYSGSNSVETDADGNPVPGSSTAEKWFMKYIGSHMTVIKVEYDELARPTYFFKDGTALKQMNGSMQTSQEGSFRDWTFYTAYPDRCLELYGSEENARGKCAWPFLFVPVRKCKRKMRLAVFVCTCQS